MGVDDFAIVVKYISDAFDVQIGLLFLFIFLSGYITMKFAIKSDLISNNYKGIDEIFIISVTGIFWAIRCAMLSKLIPLIPSIKGQYLWIFLFVIFFTALSVTYDIRTILQFKLKYKKLFCWIPTVFVLLPILIIFIGEQTYEAILGAIFYFVLITPSISGFFWFYNKLNPK